VRPESEDDDPLPEVLGGLEWLEDVEWEPISWALRPVSLLSLGRERCWAMTIGSGEGSSLAAFGSLGVAGSSDTLGSLGVLGSLGSLGALGSAALGSLGASKV